ncbi:hypothetical protein EOM09_06525, partial [bacterium]|nr:hypothetical protein [bacterium]
MNQVIIFIFSVLIFMFGVIVVFDMAGNEKEEVSIVLMQKQIFEIKSKFNEICKDPFVSNKFDIDFNGDHQIYYDLDKVCAKKNSSSIICEKVDCNVGDKILFDFNTFPNIYA